MDFEPYLTKVYEAVHAWEESWGGYRKHAAVAVDESRFRDAFEAYTKRLEGNYPFFHPRYAGQMLKPPHPVAVVGYLAAMLINPNNHALDGGPPTSAMEIEVVSELAAMFGFPTEALGHLTSGGTVANMEAAWIARELHPSKALAVSDQGHYTHTRLGELLRMDVRVIPSDVDGKIDLDALEGAVRTGEIGTIVMTAGTTAFGAVDPIADVLPWRDRYGIRIHVDAAYGGFFTLLADRGDGPLNEETKRHFRAISGCDSVVVDPHKHGLQPYGCGCILFRDPAVGRVYRHDSPYTYFTSDALHLGEISLECSRAGAAAGALWLTLRMLPLEAERGLGAVLAAARNAARRWHNRIEEADQMRAFMEPELDILTYFPEPSQKSASAVDAAVSDLFERATAAPDSPLFLSVVRVEADRLRARHRDLDPDANPVRVLRSVLMKPEHEDYVDALHERLLDFVGAT